MGILTRAVAFHYAYRTRHDGELVETITRTRRRLDIRTCNAYGRQSKDARIRPVSAIELQPDPTVRTNAR